MAQYSFSISDYHSIDYADIRLDGITVIAGCNGSGKSTIARWIYSFVNYTNEFYHLVDTQLVNSLENKLYPMYRILRNIDMLPYPKLRQFKKLSVNYNADVDYSEIASQFKSRVALFCDTVEDAIRNNDSPSFYRWIGQSLGSEEIVSSDYLFEFYQKSLNLLEISDETAMRKNKIAG